MAKTEKKKAEPKEPIKVEKEKKTKPKAESKKTAATLVEEINPVVEKKQTAVKKAATEKKQPAENKAVVDKKAEVEKKSEPVNEVEILSPSKKLKKVKGYSKKELEEFKAIILQKREEIIEQIQNLKEQMMDPTTGQYVNENSPYSLHMAEQGTDAQEREKLYLWAQRENKFLGYLENALVRIDAGTFGICVECIDEPMNLCPTCPLIPKERLLAVPHTQHCLQVKNKLQAK